MNDLRGQFVAFRVRRGGERRFYQRKHRKVLANPCTRPGAQPALATGTLMQLKERLTRWVDAAKPRQLGMSSKLARAMQAFRYRVRRIQRYTQNSHVE